MAWDNFDKVDALQTDDPIEKLKALLERWNTLKSEYANNKTFTEENTKKFFQDFSSLVVDFHQNREDAFTTYANDNLLKLKFNTQTSSWFAGLLPLLYKGEGYSIKQDILIHIFTLRNSTDSSQQQTAIRWLKTFFSQRNNNDLFSTVSKQLINWNDEVFKSIIPVETGSILGAIEIVKQEVSTVKETVAWDIEKRISELREQRKTGVLTKTNHLERLQAMKTFITGDYLNFKGYLLSEKPNEAILSLKTLQEKLVGTWNIKIFEKFEVIAESLGELDDLKTEFRNLAPTVAFEQKSAIVATILANIMRIKAESTALLSQNLQTIAGDWKTMLQGFTSSVKEIPTALTTLVWNEVWGKINTLLQDEAFRTWIWMAGQIVKGESVQQVTTDYLMEKIRREKWRGTDATVWFRLSMLQVDRDKTILSANPSKIIDKILPNATPVVKSLAAIALSNLAFDGSYQRWNIWPVVTRKYEKDVIRIDIGGKDSWRSIIIAWGMAIETGILSDATWTSATNTIPWVGELVSLLWVFNPSKDKEQKSFNVYLSPAFEVYNKEKKIKQTISAKIWAWVDFSKTVGEEFFEWNDILDGINLIPVVGPAIKSSIENANEQQLLKYLAWGVPLTMDYSVGYGIKKWIWKRVSVNAWVDAGYQRSLNIWSLQSPFQAWYFQISVGAKVDLIKKKEK